MRRTVNLRSVAAAAGVHPSTVSRALNPATRHLIRPDVAERVDAIAREFGYRPDGLAAGLRTRRSMLVGIVVPDIANLVFAPIISGIEAELATQGYAGIVANGGVEEAHQEEIVERLIARRVDGLVLATVQRDDRILTLCLKAEVPTVLVNRAEAGKRVSAVISDDVRGMQLAAEHLIGQGHRRIAHLAGPAHLSTGFLRRTGFEKAMQAAQLDLPDQAIVTAKAFTREAGLEAGRLLLERNPGITAVVCGNDLLALGLYAALKERQLRCPHDISIVGHNDMSLVDLVEPPLTTISIGHDAMGKEAAKLLLARLEDAASPVISMMLEPKLVIRKSTAALKKPASPRAKTAR